jgi:hypothetical protein
MKNAVFDIVILRLIVAAGIILYADIGERFRLHPGTAEDPTRPASGSDSSAATALFAELYNSQFRDTGGERLTLCRT